MCFLLFQGFSALFRLFWPLKFPVAPNQHRPFCDLRQEPSNTGPPPLPGALSHTHSKTACRGVSERQWRSAANRSQLPLRSVLGAPHWGAAPEPAGETSPSLHLHHAMEELPSLSLFYSVLSHPSSTVPTPSSTQNAPGFAFFGLNRVRFAVFALF